MMRRLRWSGLLVSLLFAAVFYGCAGKPSAGSSSGARPPHATPQAGSPSVEPSSREEFQAALDDGIDRVLDGDYKKAIAPLLKAKELKPREGEVRFWLFLAYKNTESRITRRSKAYIEAQNVIALLPGTAKADQAKEYLRSLTPVPQPTAMTPFSASASSPGKAHPSGCPLPHRPAESPVKLQQMTPRAPQKSAHVKAPPLPGKAAGSTYTENPMRGEFIKKLQAEEKKEQDAEKARMEAEKDQAEAYEREKERESREAREQSKQYWDNYWKAQEASQRQVEAAQNYEVQKERNRILRESIYATPTVTQTVEVYVRRR
ncbi:MAG: hypothetical protein RDV48_04250 [Candidatus Eremiobacteraeota bacterium]|nr:hypothetical protein [Candidatus Eremiobacteraeota bacterium]